MYIYESIKDEIWRRPSDIVFHEITADYSSIVWDEQVYDLLIETHVNQVSGQVHFQVTEDLENV
jgi:hypothetical protein